MRALAPAATLVAFGVFAWLAFGGLIVLERSAREGLWLHVPSCLVECWPLCLWRRRDRWNGNLGRLGGERGLLPCCCPCWLWPLPLLARPLLAFVALAFPWLSLGCPPTLLLLLLLLFLIVVALLLLRGLHEGVVDGGQVLHDLLCNDGKGLVLSHPHGYVPRERFPEGLDLRQACVVLADQRGEPLTVLDDGLLGAKFEEDPCPLHCLDAVEDHGDAADVPIRRLFGD